MPSKPAAAPKPPAPADPATTQVDEAKVNAVAEEKVGDHEEARHPLRFEWKNILPLKAVAIKTDEAVEQVVISAGQMEEENAGLQIVAGGPLPLKSPLFDGLTLENDPQADLAAYILFHSKKEGTEPVKVPVILKAGKNNRIKFDAQHEALVGSVRLVEDALNKVLSLRLNQKVGLPPDFDLKEIEVQGFLRFVDGDKAELPVYRVQKSLKIAVTETKNKPKNNPDANGGLSAFGDPELINPISLLPIRQ